MELQKYDGQCVQIVTVRGEVFEGICRCNSAEYNEHEFGRPEAALEIEGFLFFPGDIRALRSLEGRQGPFGRFSGPYGALEEETIREGIDSIRDALDSEEEAHVSRLLLCLAAHLNPKNGPPLPDRAAVLAALDALAARHESPAIRRAAAALVRRWA